MLATNQARESRNHDNSDIPDIIAKAVESVLGTSDRTRRSLTPDSMDDGSILVPPRKKAKRNSDVDSRQSLSDRSSDSTTMSLSSANHSSWSSSIEYGGFPSQDAYHTPSTSSTFSTSFFDYPGGEKIWSRCGDKERQNFEIHEETEEEQNEAEQIAATIYNPEFGDDNKENEPAERGEEPPSVDPTEEFDLARNVLGELLDYSQPPTDDQFTMTSVLESQGIEIDGESLPELPTDPLYFEGLFTPTFGNMLGDVELPFEVVLEDVQTDECDENTDDEFVQDDEYAEL